MRIARMQVHASVRRTSLTLDSLRRAPIGYSSTVQNPIRNVAVCALIFACSACSKPSSGGDPEENKPTKTSEKVDPKPIPTLVDVLVEDFEFGSVSWMITSDGAVKAEVKDTSGAPIKEGFAGDLKVGEGESPSTAVTLEPIQGSAIYGATLPAFDADLTPINYTFKLSGKTYVGTLHVPAGGTAVIVKAAAAPPKVVIEPGTKGPHGGVVQVVGEDRLELVSDLETGEVRVFVLDVGLKPIVVGERKVTIGVVADHPEVVVLAPEPGGLYFTAGWGIAVDPLRITLGLHVGARYDVAIVGFRPGVRLVVGAKAPVIAVRVKTGWGPPARVFVKGKWVAWEDSGKGKGKGKDKDDDDHHAGKGVPGGAIEVKVKGGGNEGKVGGGGGPAKGGNEGKGSDGKGGGGGGGKKGKH